MSSPLGPSFSFQDMVADLTGVADLVGRPFHLNAWGWGCFVAAAYTATHPTSVISLSWHLATRWACDDLLPPAGMSPDQARMFYSHVLAASNRDLDGPLVHRLAARCVDEVYASASHYAGAVRDCDLVQLARPIAIPILLHAHPMQQQSAAELAAALPQVRVALRDLFTTVDANLGADERRVLDDHLTANRAGAIDQARAAVGALTPREREILALLARGLTNAEIGLRLSIANTTVARHIANVFGKLKVGSRTEAAAFVFERALETDRRARGADTVALPARQARGSQAR